MPYVVGLTCTEYDNSDQCSTLFSERRSYGTTPMLPFLAWCMVQGNSFEYPGTRHESTLENWYALYRLCARLAQDTLSVEM